MKPLLLSCVLLFSLQAGAQKTYISFKVSYPVIGTPRELKSGMRASGYDNSTSVAFVKHYPYASKYPSVAVEWGKYIKEKTSFSVLAGLQEAGQVNGYNTNRGGIRINYTNWVLNPKINFHRMAAILGIGPSALLVQYKRGNYPFTEYSHSKLLPGVSLTAESVSRKKKGFRMGVFAALNLQPGFDIEPVITTSNGQVSTFQSTLNPSSLLAGFRFQF